MTTLPQNPDLPVHLLTACFNNTSATYKFYWFLAILNRVETGETIIRKQHLFAEMISHAWFTVNYFHVSFGKQDKIQQAVRQLQSIERLSIDQDRVNVSQQLAASVNKQTQQQLWYFDSEVPHRFLSPWIKADNKMQVYAASLSFTNDCLYALYKDQIIINPQWVNYLQQHAGILKAFCYWNLTMYLQAKNPNVPDIPNKLIRSPIRKGLGKQRKEFWDIVLNELGGIDCIYTNKRLQAGTYAVEHFIPHAFVAHDLIWNLIPADSGFNNTKSDKLPTLAKYFDPFFQIQRQAVEIINHKQPQNKYLEDYLTLFPTLEPEHFTRDKFLEHLQPLVTIASNNGFEFL